MTQPFSSYITSGIKRFASGVFLSRITGLGRDLAMAYAFGDHPAVASFMVAFRFSNLLRRFFGEGPLQSAFIPHFEQLRSQDPEAAYRFFRRLTLLIVTILCGVILLTKGSFASVLHLFSISEENQQILKLTDTLMPCLLFISLYGINIAVLQCHQTFFLSTVAPALCNFAWISGAFYLKGIRVEAAMGPLAKWIVMGFFMQWVITLPRVYRCVSGNWKQWLIWKIDPEVKKLIKAFSLGALGVGAVQINAFLDALFSRAADVRAPIYLWYSIRFQQLALAIFGMAIVGALVPHLSRKVKEGAFQEAKEVFEFGVRRIFTTMLCSTFAILALGLPAIELVYGRGSFSFHAVTQTTFCFWGYSAGLIPSALILLCSAVFYAEGNFHIPTKVAIVAVIINVLLNTIFVFFFKFGPISIALSTSVGAWVNYLILHRLLIKREWRLGFSPFDLSPIILGATIAASSAFTALFFMKNSLVYPSKIGQQLLEFFVPAVIFMGILFSYARLRKNRDLLTIFQ
jgi:putative peptidoglycan lipid II flippase